MSEFVPGIELSRRFYHEVVRRILDAKYSGVPHAAAHLGPGSDVLGFDTEMSTDHDWGPSVHIFLREQDISRRDDIFEQLCRGVPSVFCDYPVEPNRLYITTPRAFFWQRLAYDITQPLEAVDWLTIPSQRLREVTSGAVHYDGPGELTPLRERFAYYPHDVWLYLLAATGQRIGQEEHLALRAGYVGDELGSSLIGSRLVRDIMNLCFLMERKYAPYAKWFGTAFQQLICSESLAPILWRVQIAPSWREREAALCESYVYIAGMHNSLGITAKIPESVTDFFGRPFNVIFGGRFADALLSEIRDDVVKSIACRPLIGGIDQFTDNTDMREKHVSPVDSKTSWRHVLKRMYTESP